MRPAGNSGATGDGTALFHWLGRWIYIERGDRPALLQALDETRDGLDW